MSNSRSINFSKAFPIELLFFLLFVVSPAGAISLEDLLKTPAAKSGEVYAHKAWERLHSEAAKSGKNLAEETLKKRGKTAIAKSSKLPAKTFLLVISSSIPEETLRTYASQAEKLLEEGVSVRFLLRGFVGGIKRIGPTIRFYMSFALRDPGGPPTRENLRPVELSIDPEKTRSISAVPALMDERECVVYGDAPLPYLIEKLSEGACGKVFGATYAPAERDALEEIREAAARAAPLLARMRRLIAAKFRNVEGVFLPPARANRSFRIRRTFHLKRDLYAPDGRLIARAGTYDLSSSPVPLSELRIFVVNGNHPEQLSWLKRELSQNYGLVLVSGKVGRVCQEVSVPCYPLTAEVVRAFSLEGTPARISGSTDGTFEVREFLLPKNLPTRSLMERRRASASSRDLKPTISTEGSGTKRTSPVKGSGAEFSSLGTKAMN